jgi:hypothetical protein
MKRDIHKLDHALCLAAIAAMRPFALSVQGKAVGFDNLNEISEGASQARHKISKLA